MSDLNNLLLHTVPKEAPASSTFVAPLEARIPIPLKIPTKHKVQAIITPYVGEFIKAEAIKAAKDEYNAINKKLNYEKENIYDKLVDDAINWYLTKNSK